MPEKRRILFVDDEANLLDGLKRALRSKRSEWDMTFALGAEAALRELRAAPFHVVVSDMRMPGMDGATLLAQVQQEFPEVVRIILSGFTELEASLRASPVIHQFLSKPCDLDVLSDVITRASCVEGRLHDPNLLRVVGQIERLPTLPETYRRLTEVLQSPTVTIDAVTAIVESDVAICAKVLQLANSAFFGVPQQTSSTHAAIVALGIGRLRSLVLSVQLFDDSAYDLAALPLAAMERHAFCAAHLASAILTDRHETDDAFAAALLHDVGLLVLASSLPSQCATLLEQARATGLPAAAVEIESGITHTEIGAYLLELWGLPKPVVDAVAHYRDPRRGRAKAFDVTGAVHTAVALAHACGPSGGDPPLPLDTAYLEEAGVAAELPRWQSLAQGICGGVAGPSAGNATGSEDAA